MDLLGIVLGTDSRECISPTYGNEESEWANPFSKQGSAQAERKALKLSLLMLQGSRIKLRAACRAPPGIWQRSCRTFWTDTRSFHHTFPAIGTKFCANCND